MVISLKCMVIALKCRSISLKCRSISLKCRGISLKCRGLSLKCRVISLKCRGLSLKCMVISPKCRGLSLKCMVLSLQVEQDRRWSGKVRQILLWLHWEVNACTRLLNIWYVLWFYKKLIWIIIIVNIIIMIVVVVVCDLKRLTFKSVLTNCWLMVMLFAVIVWWPSHVSPGSSVLWPGNKEAQRTTWVTCLPN